MARLGLARGGEGGGHYAFPAPFYLAHARERLQWRCPLNCFPFYWEAAVGITKILSLAYLKDSKIPRVRLSHGGGRRRGVLRGPGAVGVDPGTDRRLSDQEVPVELIILEFGKPVADIVMDLLKEERKQANPSRAKEEEQGG
jgi:hypothetical protein